MVRLMFAGKSRKEIASEMGVTVNTVDSYLARAMEKLGMKTVEEAAEAIGRLRDAWNRFTGQK